MEIIKNIKVPTGNILIVSGDYGNLECLSIGDYGKSHNIKADFLNITRKINGVPNGEIMSLTKKWVVTISSQYGCAMGCKFCDVPLVGKGRNASLNDLTDQVLTAISLHPEITHTNRLNIHYARMGEPTFNRSVLDHVVQIRNDISPYLSDSLIHPVISTMLPRKNKNLERFIQLWCNIKNFNYDGNAGLQFSINSTDREQREYLFSGNALTMEEISSLGKRLPKPKGRKYTLNIALADDTIVNAKIIASLFSPDNFMVKVTPIHITNTTLKNNIKTEKGYNEFTPYEQIEEELKKEGFDVLVFIPSLDEDSSRITCGNAILSSL